jgi:GNAT superfamily N-acetyltransferase
MELKRRAYQDDEDYWRIREFLRQVMLLNDRRELSWHVARLDYWWWFGNPDLGKMDLTQKVFLWETAEGEIAAVVNPEEHAYAYPQVHPDFKTPELAEEVVAAAEEHIAEGDDRHKQLVFWIDSKDKIFQEVLIRRGFQRNTQRGEQEYQHRRGLEGPLPERMSIPGYTIRAQGDGLELLERCYASGLGFHEDDVNVARKNRDNIEWYRHIQDAPLYRRDLDLIAVAEDGSIASFCTIWFDDVTRTAYFEPVATVPAHRKKGLGKAVLLEGLHRIQRMGCKVAFVGGYSERANALYFSIMGLDYDMLEPWGKTYEL